MRPFAHVVGVGLLIVFSLSAHAQLSGTRTFSGQITNLQERISLPPDIDDWEVVDSAGVRVADAFSVGDEVEVTFSWNLSSTPVGTSPPFSTGVLQYALNPAEFTLSGHVGGVPLSSVPVQILIANDATNLAISEPFDTWRLIFGDVGSCPHTFAGPLSGVVFLSDSLGQPSANPLSSNEFQVPTSDDAFPGRGLTIIVGLVDPATGACVTVIVTAVLASVDMLEDGADDGIEMTMNQIVEIGGAGELWTGSGPLLGQSLSRVVGESGDTFAGAVNTVTEGEDFNCVIGVPGCTGAPGVASLTTGTSLGGLDAVHIGSAGDDVVTIDSQVLGVGSIENTGAAPASVASSMSAEDWSTVYFGIFGGASPPTIDIDMTYSVAASVSNDSTGVSVPVNVTATGSLGLYDVASLVPDTMTATLTELFGVTATASTTSGAAPSVLEETVTLTFNTNALYWEKLSGQNEVRLDNLLPGLTNVTGLDTSASTFVDPRFEVNPAWAAANPEAAASLVIERTSSTALLDVAIWPWFGGPNLIDVRSRFSVVAVAILGNEAFAAESIDESSLRFGPEGATPLHWPRPKLHDLDRDGDLDLLAYFKVGATGLGCGDDEAVLSAQTTVGLPVAGADDIRPFPCRPKPHRHPRHHKHR